MVLRYMEKLYPKIKFESRSYSLYNFKINYYHYFIIKYQTID